MMPSYLTDTMRDCKSHCNEDIIPIVAELSIFLIPIFILIFSLILAEKGDVCEGLTCIPPEDTDFFKGCGIPNLVNGTICSTNELLQQMNDAAPLDKQPFAYAITGLCAVWVIVYMGLRARSALGPTRNSSARSSGSYHQMQSAALWVTEDQQFKRAIEWSLTDTKDADAGAGVGAGSGDEDPSGGVEERKSTSRC